MELTETNIVYYLLENGFVTLESVVDGDFAVVESSRRNRNFKVIRKHSPGLFVKQSRSKNRAGHSSLQYEATLYQLMQSSPALTTLAPFVPAYRHYDAQSDILIVGLLQGGLDLYTHHARLQTFPPESAASLGRLLGCLHRHKRPALMTGKEQPQIGGAIPWIFSFCTAPSYPSEFLSDGNIEMLDIVQSYPQFLEALTRLTPLWRSDTLIHNDIRLENCILCPVAESGGQTELKLVDWELAMFGDPLWDVGAVFQAYLAQVIRVLQVENESAGSEAQPPAGPTVSDMQTALRTFWQTYAAETELDTASADAALTHSVLFAGIRLIQTAFEQTQGLSHLTPDVAYQLQASSNLLENPQDGIQQLMGL